MSARVVVGSNRSAGRSILENLETRVLFAAGDLDATFGSNGKNIDDALGNLGQDIATLSNGRIIVTARANEAMCVIRNLASGPVDAAFGTDRDNLCTLSAINDRVLQSRRVFVLPSNKIICVGEAFDEDPNTGDSDDNRVLFTKYDALGNPDTTFGNQGGSNPGIRLSSAGGASFGAVRDVVMQKDGKFITVGRDGNKFIIMRFLANGATDTSFGTSGVTRVSFGTGNAFASAVVVQSNGKIVVAGTAHQSNNGNGGVFALTRLTAAGKLDTTFGKNGITTTSDGNAGIIASLTIQKDGKIVAGGASGATVVNGTHFVLLRYSANGILDKTFGMNGLLTKQIGPNSFCTQVAIDATGQILFAGYTNGEGILCGRVQLNGKEVDPNFNPVGGQGPAVGSKLAPLAARTVEPHFEGQDAYLDFITNSRARIIPQKGKILIIINTSSGTTLSRIFNDSLKPAFAVVSATDILKSHSIYKFSIKFSDNIAVQTSSLGSDDFLVTGPGYQVPATVVFVSVDKTANGSPRVATYKLAGPNGTWTRSVNGKYTITLQPSEVSDLAQNFMKKVAVKTFKVAIPATASATRKTANPQAILAQDSNEFASAESSMDHTSAAATLFSTNSVVARLDEDDVNEVD